MQQVARHQEVELAGGQQRTVVDLRTALHDLTSSPEASVGAVGEGPEPAMPALGLPVGAEPHRLQGLGEGACRDRTSSAVNPAAIRLCNARRRPRRDDPSRTRR
jgi:hypothetical protein